MHQVMRQAGLSRQLPQQIQSVIERRRNKPPLAFLLSPVHEGVTGRHLVPPGIRDQAQRAKLLQQLPQPYPCCCSCMSCQLLASRGLLFMHSPPHEAPS